MTCVMYLLQVIRRYHRNRHRLLFFLPVPPVRQSSLQPYKSCFVWTLVLLALRAERLETANIICVTMPRLI